MNTYTRRPEWTVTIKRPDYTKSKLTFLKVPEWSQGGVSPSLVHFVSSSSRENGTNTYTDLIEYEYDNTIKSPANPFSLTLVPKQGRNGLTWKDKIRESDMVFISEFGKVRYIGIVRGTGYSMSLNNGKPTRSITITGESIGGKLQSFNLPMNIYLWYDLGTTAEIENTKLVGALNSKLDEGQNIGKIFSLIKDSFFKVMFGAETKGFPSILNEFFALDADNLEAFYPMNLKPFQEDSNTLWEIFRQILPEPVYEIFGRYIDGKYKITCRETPFDQSDWDDLTITKLDPLFLIEQNLNDSDGEVFTHYFSTMPNSALSPNEIYANNSLNQVSVFDNDKLPEFGYKQLQATFPFFDLEKRKSFSSIEFLKDNSARLYAWYHNNLEFQSGSITMHTVPNEGNEYINIGERIQYLEGDNYSIEFYVEGVKRKMTYGETMTSIYSVTRGFDYGKGSVTIDGKTLETPQIKKISQMGRKLIQIEKDLLQGEG